MKRLTALLGALVLLVGTGFGLMAFDDPNDEARVSALEERVEHLCDLAEAAGDPCPHETATPVATSTVTPEPTATATDEPEPTATEHEHPSAEATEWHAADGHEHGDAPPQWVTDWNMQTFGHGVIYGGDESTPRENEIKHNAYKGHIVPRAAGGQAYVRYHSQSNPHGRAAQFHSFEFWYRDTQGGVTFFQGWLDCGNPNTARFPRSQGDPGQRPAMLVVDQAAWNANIRFEQWYCFSTGARIFEMGVSIGNTTTIWHAGEQNNNPHDQGTWDTTGSYGTNRLVDFFLIRSRYGGHTGEFCLTTAGQPVGCGADGALYQYIAPTFYGDMRLVCFGSNCVERISGQRQVSFALPNPALPN